METMKAFWRYDWARNQKRLVTVAMLAALWPWGMGVAQVGVRSGALWAHFVLAFSVTGFLAIPFLLLEYIGELGRNGGPLDYRHFSRSLPLEAGQWPIAKIASALGWGVLMPSVLVLGMISIIVHVLDEPGRAANQDWVRQCASGTVLLSVLSAGALWLMLCTAVIPYRLGRGIGMLFGLAMFSCGELLVRGVTGIRELEQTTKRVRAPWESASEAGLCLALAVAIGLVFVRFHRNRRLGQALLLALGALVAVDAVRAWLWWRSGA